MVSEIAADTELCRGTPLRSVAGLGWAGLGWEGKQLGYIGNNNSSQLGYQLFIFVALFGGETLGHFIANFDSGRTVVI